MSGGCEMNKYELVMREKVFMDKDGKVSFDANKFNDILYAVKHLDGKVTVIFELSKALPSLTYQCG